MPNEKTDHVHVVAEKWGNDIRCLLILKGKDGQENKTSKLLTLVGKSWCYGGNPPALYGDEIEEQFGIDFTQYSVTVSSVTSGTLDGWAD